MAIVVATLLIFAAGPFVLWPLIKTPPDELVTSAPRGDGGLASPPSLGIPAPSVRGDGQSTKGDRPGASVP
jgi:hypothetical protein